MAGFLVMLQGRFEKAAIGLARQARQQGADGFADIRGNALVQCGAAAEGLTITVLR